MSWNESTQLPLRESRTRGILFKCTNFLPVPTYSFSWERHLARSL